jgi:GrpB-like predicted nucleotidyltransferase (UPF0157 family)
MAQLPIAESVFRLVPAADAHRLAAVAYARWFEVLSALLPDVSTIEHVGATSIAGCLTKGDLDIVVRVRPCAFANAGIKLASQFERNVGSACSPEYSPFICDDSDPPLGVQLVVEGSEFDFFHTFRDALRSNPRLLTTYNALKREHEGRAMTEYRSAKAVFVAEVLSAARQP